MRWTAIALMLCALGCGTSTSVTRTGTGIFAPHPDNTEEEEAPRGLSLSFGAIGADGTVSMDLRNYSPEPFVFSGTPESPQLVIEVETGTTSTRQVRSPWSGRKTYEVPAGERVQLKANIGGASGRIRIGIRSREFGYTVWTDWIAR